MAAVLCEINKPRAAAPATGCFAMQIPVLLESRYPLGARLEAIYSAGNRWGVPNPQVKPDMLFDSNLSVAGFCANR